jgi:transposase
VTALRAKAIYSIPAARFCVAQSSARSTCLIRQRVALSPELIVLEASGGCETALVGELVDAELPVVVVNPR